jgi:23S rRNA (guanosine2251-2'-O)-methyltransferase
MAQRIRQITLEGRNMVHDALTSDKEVKALFLSAASRGDEKIKEIEELAKKRGVQTMIVAPDDLLKMAESKNPQGVVAKMDLPEDLSFEGILRAKRNAFVLLLNHIDYEQNLGAIIRTAWAAGVDAVVVSPNGVHEVTSVVAKVSMGGVAHVPVFGMSLFQAIKLIHEYAIPLVGVEVDKGKSIYDTNLRGPVAIMMGGEEVGITEPLMKECDTLTNIPMVGKIASLNVSVATAIVLFEKLRQER